jgi:uncharacterized protein with HEPN domain
MSLRTDSLYLGDMRDAALKVLQFTSGLTFEEFLANEEK